MPPRSFRPRLESLEARELLTAPGPDLVGVVRNGTDWFLAGDRVSENAARVRTFTPTGRALSGDWNGDRKTDLIVAAPNAEGGQTWQVDTNGDHRPDFIGKYGLVGDVPFVGDVNRDGVADWIVARPNRATGMMEWFATASKADYANPPPHPYGLMTDTPVVGDWDGDGAVNFGVVRPDPGVGLLQWHLDTTGDLWPEIVRHYGRISTRDVPVTGDWNGDGRTDLGVTQDDVGGYRKVWLLDTNGDTLADFTQRFGFPTDRTVVGRWAALPVVPSVPPPSDPPPPEVPPEVLRGYPPVAPAHTKTVYPDAAFRNRPTEKFHLTVDVGAMVNGRSKEIPGTKVTLLRNGRVLVNRLGADEWTRVRFRNLKDSEWKQYKLRVEAPGYRTKDVDVRQTTHQNVTFLETETTANVRWGTVEVRFKTFIPSPVIGLPLDGNQTVFTGDNRTFDYADNRYRSFQNVIVSLDPSRASPLVSLTRDWGETVSFIARTTRHTPGKPGWWRDHIGRPQVFQRQELQVTDTNSLVTASWQNGSAFHDTAVVRLQVHGGNPLEPLSPLLDADVTVTLRRLADGRIEYTLSGAHDGFPAYEVYLNGMGVYGHDPVQERQTLLSMFPPMEYTVARKGTIAPPRPM